MKYVIFDMDDTLFKSVGPEGRVPNPTVQKAHAWWKSPESLSPNLDIPGLTTQEKVHEARKAPNTYVVMITHRQPKLKTQIIALLKKYGLGFDKVIITPSTNSKADVLLKKIPKIKEAESVEIYEDSIEHILTYKELFGKLNIPITLHLVSLRHIATLENIEVSNLIEMDYYYK